jgi:glutamate carboxypeptidase
VDPWIRQAAERVAARAERELEALVAVSTPSGDIRGAEEAAAVVAALLPDAASVERPPCSSPDHAPDVLARVTGEGERRILLVGHLDTVVAHADHRPLRREGDQLVGSGSIDMKGGDVLALGVLRALTETRRAEFAEVALLLVCDEEWRLGDFAHARRFAGWDACLCFEAGERDAEDQRRVVVKRKAAGTVRVTRRAARPTRARRPTRAATRCWPSPRPRRPSAACHDPDGPDRRTAVPTVLHAGDAFNVVPAHGELICDVRATT